MSRPQYVRDVLVNLLQQRMHLIRNKIIYNPDSNGTYQIFVLRVWNSFTIDIALVCD